MGAPVLQFKRGQFSNLPGLRAGEPGFTTDKFDLYVGIDSTTSNNKFFGSHRYWNKETTTVGSSVRLVEGSNNGANYIALKSPNSLAANVTYTLPATDVANGILVSDGSGNLSYTTTVTGSGSGLSAGTTPLTTLDIDGGTDIGADIADADLFIVDDGAGGTNRKTAASRIKNYVLGGGAGATFGAIKVSGIGTVAFVDATQLKVSGVSTFTGTLDVNGAIDADGGANIAGGETVLSSATVSDLTDNRVVIAGTSGALEDSGNLTFNGSTLGVTGAVTASGTITGGQFTGSGAGLSGGTTPLSTLDIDGGTDIGADLVDADLIVVDDGAGGTNRKSAMSRVKSYVLGGGSGATFAAINVTGIGSVAFVDATQLKVSGVSTFTGTLDVNGAIDADGGANIAGGETVLSSATVSDLTDNRVVIAGTSGALEDSGNLTFNGSALGVTGTVTASSTVTASAFHTGAEGSAIRVTSNTISGPATITLDPAGVGDNTGKVVIAGDFQVDGTTTTVNSTTMTVDDKNLELGTGAANDAAANGGGITIVSGDGNKTFNFEATGDNLGSSENLNIASGKAFKVNNVDTLNATTLGSAVVNSSLTNVGTLTALTVSGNASVEGNVDLGNATSDTITATGRFDSDLVPSTDGARDLGTSDLEWKDLFLDGTAHVDTLDVDTNAGIIGNATVGGTFDVTGATNLNNTTQSTSNTTGALIVDGGVGIAKNAHIGGTLDVDGQLTSAAPLRNSTGAGLIPGVGVITATSDAGLVTAFKFRGNGLEDFIVQDGIADVVLTGTAATTYTSQQTTVATEGQTAVTVSANYTAGFVDVYLNGVRLITGTDYTETNSTTVTLSSGATAGDEIQTVAWKSLGDIVHIQSLKTAADLTVTGVTTSTGGFVGNITGNITGSLASATANTLPLNVIDIDGGTDIGADLADADLFIVDDGAGGTNRKVTFSRLSENILGGSSGATFAAVNVTGIGTFGGIIDGNGGANISGGAGLVASSAKVSDLTAGRVVLAGTSGEIEDSGNLTFDGSTLAVTGAATVSTNLTISGNLTVNGTTTQINTVNTTIEDTLLELQKVDGGNLGSDTNKDVGIVMNYYDGSAKKAAMFWDDSAGRFAFGSVVTETTGVLGSVTYGGVEMGSLYLNDCAGASQVISCSGTTRSLENITIDGGSF